MLTPKAIAEAPDFLNAVHKRELLLRERGITDISYLETTRNEYDAIDLTGNLIGAVRGVPVLTRLEGLLLGNNIIESVDAHIGEMLPNLIWLSLADNRLTDLASLSFLNSLQKLEHVSLVGNPVTESPDYRLNVIARQPKIRFLDFQRVTDAERKEAKEKFSQKGKDSAEATD